ncbi:hypothetical protein I3843_16G088900 [Carya illinoinensis]|nr:hypothetical protein I3843_16G088900 [Carya illinoinensis]
MPTLGSISRAAFEINDYTRTVEILHKRIHLKLAMSRKEKRLLQMWMMWRPVNHLEAYKRPYSSKDQIPASNF